MSLQSLTNQHTVSIERLASTSTSAMGRTTAYSTSNRPSGAPIELKCRVVPASSNDVFEFRKRGIELSHTVYSTTDPQVDERDQFVINSRELKVRGTKTPDEMGLAANPRLTHYMTFCEEKPSGA